MAIDDYFSRPDVSTGLERTALRGSAVTLAGQAGGFVVTLISTAVFARLLSPHDFGLVAMVIPLTLFLGFFRDLGLSTATVQQATISHDQISSLFWINVGLGVVLAMVAAAAAPLAAWFFRQQEVAWLTIGYGLNSLLIGLSVQHLALLRRKMRFGVLAASQIGASLIGLVAGIVGAIGGAGYWSLVIMSLASSIATVASAWWLCRWRPSRPVRGSGVRRMLRFGGLMTGANIAYLVSINLDTLAIGRWLGAVPLGHYNRANQMYGTALQQLIAPLGAVAVPALSRLQDDDVRLRATFLSGLQLLSIASVPLACVLIVGGDALTYLVLGAQWPLAGDLVRILAIGGLFAPAGAALSWLAIARGDAAFLFKWNVGGIVLKAAAVAIGIQWGVQGVAIGMASAFGISFVLLAWILGRKVEMRATEVLSAMQVPLMLFGPALAAALGVRHLVPWVQYPWGPGLMAIATFTAIGLTVALAVPRTRRIIGDAFSLLKNSRQA